MIPPKASIICSANRIREHGEDEGYTLTQVSLTISLLTMRSQRIKRYPIRSYSSECVPLFLFRVYTSSVARQKPVHCCVTASHCPFLMPSMKGLDEISCCWHAALYEIGWLEYHMQLQNRSALCLLFMSAHGSPFRSPLQAALHIEQRSRLFFDSLLKLFTENKVDRRTLNASRHWRNATMSTLRIRSLLTFRKPTIV